MAINNKMGKNTYAEMTVTNQNRISTGAFQDRMVSDRSSGPSSPNEKSRYDLPRISRGTSAAEMKYLTAEYLKKPRGNSYIDQLEDLAYIMKTSFEYKIHYYDVHLEVQYSLGLYTVFKVHTDEATCRRECILDMINLMKHASGVNLLKRSQMDQIRYTYNSRKNSQPAANNDSATSTKLQISKKSVTIEQTAQSRTPSREETPEPNSTPELPSNETSVENKTSESCNQISEPLESDTRIHSTADPIQQPTAGLKLISATDQLSSEILQLNDAAQKTIENTIDDKEKIVSLEERPSDIASEESSSTPALEPEKELALVTASDGIPTGPERTTCKSAHLVWGDTQTVEFDKDFPASHVRPLLPLSYAPLSSAVVSSSCLRRCDGVQSKSPETILPPGAVWQTLESTGWRESRISEPNEQNVSDMVRNMLNLRRDHSIKLAQFAWMLYNAYQHSDSPQTFGECMALERDQRATKLKRCLRAAKTEREKTLLRLADELFTETFVEHDGQQLSEKPLNDVQQESNSPVSPNEEQSSSVQTVQTDVACITDNDDGQQPSNASDQAVGTDESSLCSASKNHCENPSQQQQDEQLSTGLDESPPQQDQNVERSDKDCKNTNDRPQTSQEWIARKWFQKTLDEQRDRVVHIDYSSDSEVSRALKGFDRKLFILSREYAIQKDKYEKRLCREEALNPTDKQKSGDATNKSQD